VKFTYSSPYFIFEERLENCKHCIEIEWLIDHMESFEPQGKCLLETTKKVTLLFCLQNCYTKIDIRDAVKHNKIY